MEMKIFPESAVTDVKQGFQSASPPPLPLFIIILEIFSSWTKYCTAADRTIELMNECSGFGINSIWGSVELLLEETVTLMCI